MSGGRSLRRVLARQWVTFALLLFAGFSAMAVLLLYMLEDSFIDRHLRRVGDRVVTLAAPADLPLGFRLMDRAAATGELRDRTRAQRPGVIREFRLRDNRYLHVLAGEDHHGRPFLLSYDVSDQLTVNASLARGWPWLVLAAFILAASAYALASRFVGRISRRTRELVAQVGQADGPMGLRRLAQQEDITEFSELARLNAEAWEARLAALELERQTLAFLAHELRTPLQSARTSLALLHEDRDNADAWTRLRRAVERLVRASQGVLWLAGKDAAGPAQQCHLDTLLGGLIQEFAPLAAARQQSLHCLGDCDVSWPLPSEVMETVLANVLLNAIQHGGPGRVELAVAERSLTVCNSVGSDTSSTGFGLGLQVVQRLLTRFGWEMATEPAADRVVLRLFFSDSPASRRGSKDDRQGQKGPVDKYDRIRRSIKTVEKGQGASAE